MRLTGLLILLIFCGVSTAAQLPLNNAALDSSVNGSPTIDTAAVCSDSGTLPSSSLPQLHDSLTMSTTEKQEILKSPGVTGDSIVRIAITPFIGRSVDSGLVSGFSDRFRILFSELCPLPVASPLQINHLLKDSNWSGEKPCDHNECFVEMGKVLGVRYIIGGSVGSMGDMVTFAIRMVDVQNGKVIHFKLLDTRQKLPDILYKVLPGLAVEFNNKLSIPQAAMVSLKSEPPGALVLLDESFVGTTPVIVKNIEAGQHSIRLQKNFFSDTTDTVTLSSGMWSAKNYPLSFTEEHLKRTLDRQRMLWVARGVGVLGSITALSVGLHYNSVVASVADEQEAIVNEYKKKGTAENGILLTERYNHQEHLFTTWSIYRNLCYVATAVLAAGVSVSFAF